MEMDKGKGRLKRALTASTTDRDPLTLPVWRKVAMVITVALAAFQGNYAAGAHLIAFKPMSDYYGVSITAIANTIGIGILGIGVGPLLWSPLASASGLGRRKTFLLAWSIYVPLTFWLAFAKTFNSFAAARFLSMFCASVAQTLPAQQIGETFDQRFRGTAMSTWALLMTAGPVSTAIVGAGLLKINPGPEAFRHIYYFVIVTSAVVWLLILFFVPETAYVTITNNTRETTVTTTTTTTAKDAEAVPSSGSVKDEKDVSWHSGGGGPALETEDASSSTHHRTGNAAAQSAKRLAPWYYDIPKPLTKFLDLRVFLCALLFAITFGWTVGVTIINPQVFEQPPWSFDSVQVGAVYMGALIGAIIGKLLGGYVVDVSLIKWRRRTGETYAEQRLWALFAFLPFGIVGILCYGYGIGQRLSWPVAVIAGQGILYFFFNIVSSTTQTYVVECEQRHATRVVCFMNLVKCAFAFGVPFFLPAWALADGHTFEIAYIVQMVVNVVLCLATVALALFLRNGATKRQYLRQKEHGEEKRLALRFSFSKKS